MKFLISITLVVLVMNFFAQAQGTDSADALPEGATAIVVDNEKTVRSVAEGTAYNMTQKGGKDAVQDVQGVIPKCDLTDGKKCSPTAPGLISNNTGKNTTNVASSDPKAKVPKVDPKTGKIVK